MIIDTPTGRIIPIFNCAGLQVDAIYEDQFVFASEHITLRTAPNGKTFYRDEAASLILFEGPQGLQRDDLSARVGVEGLADYHPVTGV